MTKKLLTITLAIMMVLSMSTVSASVYNVKAQVLDNTLENANEETFKDRNTNNDNKNIIEDNVQYENANLGKKEYSITEAPGPIVEVKENQRVIDPNKPMIAITYDDGPSIYTPEILDVLKENNSVATFFVLGQSVYNNEAILNQMLEDGNQIGNHTYNHKKLTTISDEELYKQVQGTDDLIRIATGYTPTVMRPPYGTTNEELNKKIQRPVIHWSIDTRDWENKNVDMITTSILDNVKDGDIILMHDLYNSTAEASKLVIPELVNRGYQLVTIDELFEHRQATLIAGQQYYNMYR